MSALPVLPTRITVVEVALLAGPILVSMMSFTATLVVDALYVARLGPEPLAAVGLAMPATWLMIAFPMGLVRAVKVVVAQRTGAADADGVERTFRQAALLGLGFGVLLALLAPFSGWIVHALGAREAVAAHAAGFVFVRALGAPVTLLRTALAAWFEGRSETKTPMRSMLVTNLANIALGPVFIFGWGGGPAWGVTGAAIATVLAEALGLFPLLRSPMRPPLFPGLRPDWELIRAVMKIGTPMGLRIALEVGAWAAFVSLLARGDTADLAAHVMVIRIVSVSFLPGQAFGEAGAVFVGQAVGARRPDLARAAWRASARLAVVMMSAFAFVFVAFPDALMAPFGVDPAVLAVGRDLMVLGALFQIADALAMAGQSALTGAGDTRYVLLTSVGASWLVQVPLAWWVTVRLGLGAPGAWVVLTVTISLLAAVTLLRLRGDAWLQEARRPLAVEKEEAVEREAAVA